MSHHTWFEHFKEQLQGLTESFEQSGSPLSLLGYALQEQRLRSDEYLNWAMTHYKLPLLQSRFFTETPVSQEMFAKWATHYPWSAECLPVAEWDGSLIVACLQPPQDFPSSPTSIIVLASYENLTETWNHLHPEKALPSTTTAVATDAPEGIDLSVATVTKQGPSDSFSFDDLQVDGADVAAASDLDTLSLDEAPEKSNEGLDGIFDSVTVTRLEALPSSETPIVTESTQSTISPEPATEIPVTETLTLEEPVVVPQKKNIPPPPPPKATMPPPFEESFGNKTLPITPRPAGVAKPTINPVANGLFALDKYKKKNAPLLNEKVKKVLSEMKAHFEKSMILTLDEQETQLTAFAWDEGFQGIKDTSMRVSLGTPSIFNIVASTQKPFHGYISLNEINEKFFESWNQGRIPDHVTITPILVNEKVIGMLMGFAEKSAYNKVSLNLAEKLSNDFVKGLQAA